MKYTFTWLGVIPALGAMSYRPSTQNVMLISPHGVYSTLRYSHHQSSVIVVNFYSFPFPHRTRETCFGYLKTPQYSAHTAPSEKHSQFTLFINIFRPCMLPLFTYTLVTYTLLSNVIQRIGYFIMKMPSPIMISSIFLSRCSFAWEMLKKYVKNFHFWKIILIMETTIILYLFLLYFLWPL